MTDRLRISLIGLGRAGRFHLQSLRASEEAVLCRVYDSDLDKARQAAQQYHCAVSRDAEEAAGAADVDAVIVATPTDTHHDYVMVALEAGKAVLTEKPLGRRLDQIDACFGLAARKNLPLFVAFQRRFDPSFASLIAAVRDDRIGTLQFVRSVSRDNPVPTLDYLRISGGIFHDCIVHDLDLICQIVGEQPTHLAAFASSFLSEIGALSDFDNVAATLSFANGVLATLDVNRRGVYGYDQRLEAFGDGGMLQAENRHETTVVNSSPSGVIESPIEYSFPTRYRQAYLAELECFLRCARGEMEAPITHQDVRVNYLLATGLEIAARERRVVRFDEIQTHLLTSGDTNLQTQKE